MQSKSSMLFHFVLEREEDREIRAVFYKAMIDALTSTFIMNHDFHLTLGLKSIKNGMVSALLSLRLNC